MLKRIVPRVIAVTQIQIPKTPIYIGNVALNSQIKRRYSTQPKIDPELDKAIKAKDFVLATKIASDRIQNVEEEEKEQLFLIRGIMNFKLKKFEESEKDLKECVQRSDNKNIVALNFLVDTLVRQDKLKEAIEYCTKLINATNGTDDEPYAKRGYIYTLMKDYRSAIEDYQNAVDINPSELQLYFALGNLHEELRLHEQAIFWYNTLMDLDREKKFPLIPFFRAKCHMIKKDYKAAIDDCLAVLNLKEPYNYAYVLIARAYFEMDKYKEAAENYKKCIELDLEPKSQLYYDLARCESRLGQLQDAIDHTTKAIEFDATNEKSALYAFRGALYAANTEYQKSMDDYTKVIELDPENSEGYIGRGFAHTLMKNFDEALKDYDKAIEVEPLNLEGYKRRAHCLYVSKRYEEAIDAYTDLFKRCQDVDYKEEILTERGIVFKANEQLEEAIEDFTLALAWNPENARARIHRCEAYFILGKEKEAKIDKSLFQKLGVSMESAYY